MFKEYPKALYQGGDVAAELVIVHDDDQEQQARAAGFASAGEEKPESTAAPDTAHATDAAGDDPLPPRAELEQKARELGVEFSPRLGDAKLAERIAEKSTAAE